MQSIKQGEEILFNSLLADCQQIILKKQLFKNYQDSDNLANYGKDFVQRLELFGCTEKNEKLVLNNWIKEFALLIGDLRIHHVLTAGNAQCGKSLINTLLMVDFLVFAKLNAIWVYPTKHQVDSLVPELFGATVRNYVKNVQEYFKIKGHNLTLINSTDRQLSSRFQLSGTTAIFTYASNTATNTPKKEGLASVGTAASSFSGSLMFIDERSQIPLESVSTLPRRLDASRIPTQPLREIGTYGDGVGIEYTISRSKYHFYPHITCNTCGSEIALNPKGCLLKRFNGKYLNNNGRPIDWHHYNENDKINTAYIACSVCEDEIPKHQRINAYFKCLNTGILLTEYLKKLPIKDYESIRDIITVQLSPLLRDTQYSLGSHIIKTGLETESTKDYSQQVLGCSSESTENKVTIDLIKFANNLVSPAETEKTITLAGLDIGRDENYITIAKYWLPDNAHQLKFTQVLEKTFREIMYIAPITTGQLSKVLKRFNVIFGFVDNEPDRIMAQQIADSTCLLPADQRGYIDQVQRQGTVSTGGIDINTIFIDNEYFLDMVLYAFVNGLVKTEWDISDNGVYSPVRHFTSVHKSRSGKWVRARDKIDDFYFSTMFCEASFYYFLNRLYKENKNSADWLEGLKRFNQLF